MSEPLHAVGVARRYLLSNSIILLQLSDFPPMFYGYQFVAGLCDLSKRCCAVGWTVYFVLSVPKSIKKIF